MHKSSGKCQLRHTLEILWELPKQDLTKGQMSAQTYKVANVSSDIHLKYFGSYPNRAELKGRTQGSFNAVQDVMDKYPFSNEKAYSVPNLYLFISNTRMLGGQYAPHF